MTTTTAFSKVSVHGGHSGQFCHHARDSLAEVVRAYVDAGFTWVGITEHMPPLDDSRRYPDEVASGISADTLKAQFLRYFTEVERLRGEWAGRIRLFKAFETETYPGSITYVRELIAETRPDYIVGSLHHVGGIGIDYDAEEFRRAVTASGDLEQLYCDYFDAQFGMLSELQPAVVGHFDLIRKYDADYANTLKFSSVAVRITRNLELIADLGLIMDFNLRGFDKAIEQYPSMPVLKQALEMGVTVVPGDDSHGVSSVGRNYERGVNILRELGHSGQWQEPRCFSW